MEHDEENSPLDSKLTWPYLIQDIMDEIWLNKSSLIVVVVITLFSVITVSILPLFESFWDIPYAVGILIFFRFIYNHTSDDFLHNNFLTCKEKSYSKI
ncbi:hypothetical protein OAJ13_03215 [Euryarchaeota archaeon]|nr:hypothetical protein [Euryarchaeota archaeon]